MKKSKFDLRKKLLVKLENCYFTILSIKNETIDSIDVVKNYFLSVRIKKNVNGFFSPRDNYQNLEKN